MRPLILLAALLAAAPAGAGVWSRLNVLTLRFEGEIEFDEYERFAGVWTTSIREVIVRSEGGVTESAIKIAHVLAAADVKVTVEGECLSSCANYFFVAGRRREIRRGVVGYHGNVQACFGGEPARSEMIEEWKRHGMSPEDIRRNLERLDQEIAEEARLLRLRGVSQELFDRTCTPDKGMGDGKSYAFLLPTKATFSKYGITDILGDQDPAIMRSLPFPYAHD